MWAPVPPPFGQKWAVSGPYVRPIPVGQLAIRSICIGQSQGGQRNLSVRSCPNDPASRPLRLVVLITAPGLPQGSCPFGCRLSRHPRAQFGRAALLVRLWGGSPPSRAGAVGATAPAAAAHDRKRRSSCPSARLRGWLLLGSPEFAGASNSPHRTGLARPDPPRRTSLRCWASNQQSAR